MAGTKILFASGQKRLGRDLTFLLVERTPPPWPTISFLSSDSGLDTGFWS